MTREARRDFYGYENLFRRYKVRTSKQWIAAAAKAEGDFFTWVTGIENTVCEAD